jgi:hypothetical protein
MITPLVASTVLFTSSIMISAAMQLFLQLIGEDTGNVKAPAIQGC